LETKFLVDSPMLKNQLEGYQVKLDGTHNGLKTQNRSD